MKKKEVLFRFFRSWFWAISIALFTSCNLEQEQLDLNPGKGLAFSADTLFFDTVFTELKTITLRLRVYNPNEKAVRIRSVYVNGLNGQQPFSFSIKGRTGPQRVENVELEGLDSAYVLMSARLDGRNQNNPFILKDSLVFEVEGRSQKQDVKILAYGQDALYLRNRSIQCDTTWTEGRPIILLDTVSVKPGCVLTINPGTRVYGYNFAFMIVRGELKIEGSREKPVLFQGTRLEPWYGDVPGQWGGILIMDGARAEVKHLRLKNAFRGIQVGEVGAKSDNVPNAGLLIQNSYIHNIVDFGILGLKSRVAAVNNQFADCGEGGFAGYQGGIYQLWHNTFGYSGNNPFRRDGKFQLSFSDNFPDTRTQELFVGLLRVKVINNLIAGTEDDEIAFGERKYPGVDFDTIFHHNQLKSKQAVFFGNTNRNKGNRRLPAGFRFLNPFDYDLSADTLGSQEIFGTGIPLHDAVSNFQEILSDAELRSILATDLLGFPRPVAEGQAPDAGAYNNRKKN
jgi:hypothetical protein